MNVFFDLKLDSNFHDEKNSEMDAKFTKEYEEKMKNQKYQKMLQARKKLPAYNMKNVRHRFSYFPFFIKVGFFLSPLMNGKSLFIFCKQSKSLK